MQTVYLSIIHFLIRDDNPIKQKFRTDHVKVSIFPDFVDNYSRFFSRFHYYISRFYVQFNLVQSQLSHGLYPLLQ